MLAASFLVLGWTWFQLPVLIQSSILWLGWPVLYVVTIAQTIVMTAKLLAANAATASDPRRSPDRPVHATGHCFGP